MVKMARPRAVVGLLLALMAIADVTAQRMTDVCTVPADDTAHANLRPRFSNVFRVDVECNFQESNQTMYVREYYDLDRNRGRIRVNQAYGGPQDIYLDYDSNMVLVVTPDNSGCDTGMLSFTQDQFIFGLRTSGGLNAHLLSPAGALHFANVPQQYIGKDVIRGIIVDAWQSCQYIDVLQATATVTWYFSKRTDWDMQLGHSMSPVRMNTVGKYRRNGTVVGFNHGYDFFNFQDHVDPTDFEVPEGIYCPKRNTLAPAKAFPTIPDNFYFVGEINDNFDSVFSTLTEAYNQNIKFAGYQYKTDMSHLMGANRFTEVNDYNTGVSYTLDNLRGSCSLSSIKNAAVVFSRNINNRQVRLDTPREFFMDGNVSYQYAGSVKVRNIECERWVAITSQAKGYIGQNVTVEWYFAAESTASWNDYTYAITKYRIPIMFKLFLPGDVTSDSYTFNIFYYNVEDPGFLFFDSSVCFKGTEHKTLQFSIPKSNETVVRSNIVFTVTAIQTAISLAAGISPYRVTNVQLYFDPDGVRCSLDLLEKTPDYDDVQITGPKENSLRGALQMLNDSFTLHTLQFDLVVGTNVFTVTPAYNTLEDISDTQWVRVPYLSDSSLYSAGAFAGLAVAMLVVGGLGGAGGGFVFFK